VDTYENLRRVAPSFCKTQNQRASARDVEGDPSADTIVMLACSACAGDYENPDRTAWMPDEEAASHADDVDDADALLEEEFPAEG